LPRPRRVSAGASRKGTVTKKSGGNHPRTPLPLLVRGVFLRGCARSAHGLATNGSCATRCSAPSDPDPTDPEPPFSASTTGLRDGGPWREASRHPGSTGGTSRGWWWLCVTSSGAWGGCDTLRWPPGGGCRAGCAVTNAGLGKCHKCHNSWSGAGWKCHRRCDTSPVGHRCCDSYCACPVVVKCVR
jgi:hypothetical protein